MAVEGNGVSRSKRNEPHAAVVRETEPGARLIGSLPLLTVKTRSELVQSLDSGKAILVVYFDIAKFRHVEETSGARVAERLLNTVRSALVQDIPDIFAQSRVLLISHLWGDDFIAVIELERYYDADALQKITIATRMKIRETTRGEAMRLTGNTIDVHIGYSIMGGPPDNVELNIYKAAREAYAVAKGMMHLETARLLSEFKAILNEQKLSSVYQPILSLRSGGILGWEALIRGPRDSHFHRPDMIFSFAEEFDLLYPLEQVCRRISVMHLGEIGLDQKLFLNVHPRTISDPKFLEGETLQLISKAGLKPENVVLEITERHNIADYPYFNKTLNYFRGNGFLVAVDDVGSGFSCLQAIAEIQPDFIKVDMSLVRDIHRNRAKRSLLETFITFAEKIDSAVIAEGIEQEEELTTLINLGAHYGQGYFFATPAAPKPYPLEETHAKTMELLSVTRNRVWRAALPISEIMEKPQRVTAATIVKDVKEQMNEDEMLAGIIVVDDRNRPQGLVMRHHVDRALGTKYGMALYYEKPISHIMDRAPLIVEDTTPVETVSQVAMNRSKLRLYDHIIVTREHELAGEVSIQTLLETMTKIRIEMAKGANPLTGLPGNIAIEQELRRRAHDHQSYCMIFVDLDHFKAFNDHYGFERGDRILQFTSRLLKGVINKYGTENDLLAHVGGDDFIAFTGKDSAVGLCERSIKYFDRLIPSFYDEEDRKKGRILSYDRNGKKKWFPFISISMAILSIDDSYSNNLSAISEKIAQLKSYAKSIQGSIYVFDRRS